MPCHITQRGVDGRDVFSCDQDRGTYLRLLRNNLGDAQTSVLAWCLMNNHVHLVAIPQREDSLAVLLRRVQGRYSQYFNTRAGRTGHLWQNRFFACILGPEHLWAALRYVERNPVRAGLVVWAGEYAWSSAAAHLSGVDERRIVDMDWWRSHIQTADWHQVLASEDPETGVRLRKCTYSGRPFGGADFVSELSQRFGRFWEPGRPKKQKEPGGGGRAGPAILLKMRDGSG